MSTAVALRSEVEIEQQRATAEWRRDGNSAYLAERARAVLEVFDWVQGRPGAIAPASGDPARLPNEDGLTLELRRAESDEQFARVTGNESRRSGVLGHALAWTLRRPDTEAPIW